MQNLLRMLCVLVLIVGCSGGGSGSSSGSGGGGGSDAGMGSMDTFPELDFSKADVSPSWQNGNGEMSRIICNGSTEAEFNAYIDSLLAEGFVKLYDGYMNSIRSAFYAKDVDGARHVADIMFSGDACRVDLIITYDMEKFYNNNNWWESAPIANNSAWNRFPKLTTGTILSSKYSQVPRGIVLEQVVAISEEELLEYKLNMFSSGFAGVNTPLGTLSTYDNIKISLLEVEKLGDGVYKLRFSVTDTRLDPQVAKDLDLAWANYPKFAVGKEVTREYSQDDDGATSVQLRVVSLSENDMKGFMDKLTAAGFVRYNEGAHSIWQNGKRYNFTYQYNSITSDIYFTMVNEPRNPQATPKYIMVSPKLVKDANNERTYTIKYIPEGSEESCTAVELAPETFYQGGETLTDCTQGVITDRCTGGMNMQASSLPAPGAKTWKTKISYLYLYQGRQSTFSTRAIPRQYAVRMICNGVKLDVFDNIYWDEYDLPSYRIDYDYNDVPPR
ncbi:MAG: hypothetical protein LBV04_09395 [Deferribacteraceae bacterium]|nr:hypothetical protein [Deferribacteraceae bacterium]